MNDLEREPRFSRSRDTDRSHHRLPATVRSGKLYPDEVETDYTSLLGGEVRHQVRFDTSSLRPRAAEPRGPMTS